MVSRFLLPMLCSFALVSPAPAQAPAQDIEQALKQQYDNKVLILRHSFKSNFQQYAADGTVLKGGDEGPWTLYKYIAVKKLELKSHRIELLCYRIAYVYSKQSKRLEPSRYGEVRVKIEMPSDTPFDSLLPAQLAFGKVFLSTKSDFVNSVPEYWRDYLEKDGKPPLEDPNKAAAADQQPANANL